MGNHDTKVCDWIGFPLVVKVWTKTWIIVTILKENVLDKQTSSYFINIDIKHNHYSNQDLTIFHTLLNWQLIFFLYFTWFCHLVEVQSYPCVLNMECGRQFCHQGLILELNKLSKLLIRLNSNYTMIKLRTIINK